MTQPHETVLKLLRQEIARHNKPENMHDYQRFHKEKLEQPMGLKAPVLRNISTQTYRKAGFENGRDVLACGDFLLASEIRYMRFFAFEWAIKVAAEYEPRDFKRFEIWLKKYVTHWGSCDHLCCGPIGNLIVKFPDLVVKTHPWRRSKNRWARRAAAVCLILPVRKRVLLDEVFRTADALLVDQDDMVQKGYGWMLKEASNEFPDEVFAYVIKNRGRMPRTALRYAIEKMPPARRQEAMKKDS